MGGDGGLCLFLPSLGVGRGQMSKVSLRRLAGGTLPLKRQKGLSDLLVLASALVALQMTLFVCLQRQPGRLRRS